jgi:hypothetical protein
MRPVNSEETRAARLPSVLDTIDARSRFDAWLEAPPTEEALPEPGDGAAQLLAALIGHAQAAGCRRLDLFTTSGWRHWPLLRRLGFLPRPSDVWLGVYGPADSGPQQIAGWQCLPDDTENA